VLPAAGSAAAHRLTLSPENNRQVGPGAVSSGLGGLPGSAPSKVGSVGRGGARRDLHELAAASTPAYLTVCKRGGGTLVASPHSSDRRSMSTTTVPSA